ncbi:hypothetical protein HK096_001896, partial [Nowakowskiella sp. JEL0078]
MDLNWCICGKQTDGSLYCNFDCTILENDTQKKDTFFKNTATYPQSPSSTVSSSPSESPKEIPYLGFSSDSLSSFSLDYSNHYSLDSLNRRKSLIPLTKNAVVAKNDLFSNYV